MTSSKIYEKAIAYLTSIRAHITSQRKIIIQKAFTPPSHYTADELLKNCQKADRTISRATVYRTLTLLVKSGLLHELDLKRGSSMKCYDFNYVASPEHSHIVCADCGKVFELMKKVGSNGSEICQYCSAEADRLFTPAGIIFKGSGFYVTDNRPKQSEPAAAAKE